MLPLASVALYSNLKIDKITVWDSGNGGAGNGSSTANFLKGFIGALPPLQELAKQAGIELPEYLGKLSDIDKKDKPKGSTKE